MARSDDKPRVLMVDDEPDFVTLVRGWLDDDYRFIGFTDGVRLPERIEGDAPDLVILDARMPGTDGYEVCRRLRADPRFRETPVLFLTGARKEEDYLAALRAGATAYLTKPVERRRLLAEVRGLLPRPEDPERDGTVD